MVIVHHFPGSVKQYAEAIPFPGRSFEVPVSCPDCQARNCQIRWGTYPRLARTGLFVYHIRIQRVRCKACGRTHSLLPDFLHPYRHYVVPLLQKVVLLYLVLGLGWNQLTEQLPPSGPTRSTAREWVASFAYGAGCLLLDFLIRRLMALDPLIDLPDICASSHLNRVSDPDKRMRLEKSLHFLLLAEQLYAQIKHRSPHLHFAAGQMLSFILHWLQSQALPPRLFWNPTLSTTPTAAF